MYNISGCFQDLALSGSRFSAMKRTGQIDRRTGFTAVAMALLVTLGMSARSLPDIGSGGLSNPDTYMRLVRLRDMLASGTILHAVARDGSGHGTILHWSHLLDGLLCLLASPFCLLMRSGEAIHAAAFLFGPLSMAVLAFAIIWAAAPFADRRWLWLGAILPALSPAIISYGVAGVAHHHVAIVVVAVACWGWAARLIAGLARPNAGIFLGFLAGLGVWLTPETVPLTMMAFGGLGVAWILSPERDDLPREISLAALTFSLVTMLALLVDPPAAGIAAAEPDRISLLFAGMALAVAATGLGLELVHAHAAGRGGRAAVAFAVLLICCLPWAACFHATIFDRDMLLDDHAWHVMLGQVEEMLPVANIVQAPRLLLTGALAALLAAWLAVRRRSLLLGYVTVCAAILLAAGWSHSRFAAYPEAAGAIALPVAITLAGFATASWRPAGQSLTRVSIIVLFLLVPCLGQKRPGGFGPGAASCGVDGAIAMLAPYPGAVVLADVNDTPELLYKTQARTVGSLYHRGYAGFARLREAWRSPSSDTPPAAIDDAEISLVLGCASPVRSPLVEDLDQTTLADQIGTGHPPPWLMQIDQNPRSGQTLYQVVRAAAHGRRPSMAAAEE
jgi:hypothetical protein